MSEVIVSTKEELEEAKNDKAEYITVVGGLARSLQKGKVVATASTATVSAIAAAAIAMPFTGGASALGLAPIAALSGFEIAAIIAALSMGITLIIAICKDYEEIEASKDKIKLRRKRKDK